MKIQDMARRVFLEDILENIIQALKLEYGKQSLEILHPRNLYSTVIRGEKEIRDVFQINPNGICSHKLTNTTHNFFKKYGEMTEQWSKLNLSLIHI